MAKHSIEVADYDKSRGVVVLTEEGGDIVVRLGSDGVEIEANPAGLRDLARWCLALADPDAPSGSHIHLDPGLHLLTPESESLMLGRSDSLGGEQTGHVMYSLIGMITSADSRHDRTLAVGTEGWCGVSLVQEENDAMRLEFTLDCTDLDHTAEFWQAAVGFVVDGSIEGRYVSLSGHGVTLTLQRVAEPKTVKNRMHLDLLVENLEQEVHRLENIGASRVTSTARQEFGQTWFVLADPEGNEFCVAPEQP